MSHRDLFIPGHVQRDFDFSSLEKAAARIKKELRQKFPELENYEPLEPLPDELIRKIDEENKKPKRKMKGKRR